MKLTIKQKMVGIGLMAVTGLLVMYAVNHYAGNIVESSQALAQQRNEELLVIHATDLAQHELMLAAMDSIIDRDVD